MVFLEMWTSSPIMLASVAIGEHRIFGDVDESSDYAPYFTLLYSLGTGVTLLV